MKRSLGMVLALGLSACGSGRNGFNGTCSSYSVAGSCDPGLICVCSPATGCRCGTFCDAGTCPQAGAACIEARNVANQTSGTYCLVADAG